MKHLYSWTLILLLLLSLPGCNLNTAPSTATEQSNPSIASGSTGTRGTSPKTAQTKTTTPVVITSGILSDPAHYSKENPKSHPLVPVPRDLTTLTDNTIKANESLRPVFQKYLQENYPEYTFRVADILDYQKEGKTFKQAKAYSKESIDTVFSLYYDGIKVFDSFHRDVIERHSTMNRWRYEFQALLDQHSTQQVPLKQMNLDVSYEQYPDNIPKTKLDQPFEPNSSIFLKSLDLYIFKDQPASFPIGQEAARLLNDTCALGYQFQDIYLYFEQPAGGFVKYRIPPRLINTLSLAAEIDKALTAPGKDNLIQIAPPRTHD
ncbi:MAG: hypothetical protein QMB61_03540 [Clostridiaceae bacterium]